MHRVNIVYASEDDCQFNWAHYPTNHLSLACGVSSRHAPISYCDVDKPIALSRSGEATIVAICTVYFEDLDTQNAFRHFFANEHPDSATILADQPNYTEINPAFNAGTYRTLDGSRDNQTARVRILVPWQDDIEMASLAMEAQSLAALLAKQGIEFSCVELDQCDADVPDEVNPAYAAVLSLYSNNLNACVDFTRMENWESEIRSCFTKFSRPVQISFAALKTFDLNLCRPYLENTP
ncbi:MAG: EthD family reductase [Gammaproteobacteria bacterium]